MRKYYLDHIRRSTVLLVVVYHVIYIFNGVTSCPVLGAFSPVQFQDLFLYSVYPWFMLLLFVVSGMSSRFYLEHHTDGEFLRDRTRKLLVPSTLGVLISGWVLGYYNIRIGGGWEQVSLLPFPLRYLVLCVSGIGVLWYLQMLWIFCLLLLLLRMVEKDRFYPICQSVTVPVLLTFPLLIYGSAQILNVPVLVVYRFGIYGVGFFIGYFILSHEEVMERVEKQWLLLTVLGSVSGVLFVVSYWGKSYPDHEVLDTFLCNLFAWTGTLGVLAFMKRWFDFQLPFSSRMNRYAWGLYLFHYPLVLLSGYYLRRFAPNLPPLPTYLLVGFVGFGGSFLLEILLNRIPILRLCLLGISKQQKGT